MKLKNTQKHRTQTSHARREPTERIWYIHEQLAAGRYPNAFSLAEDLQVSRKTIARDIEYMRLNFGLPVEYDSKRFGYYYSKPVAGLPGTPGVTEAEMFSLLVAHKAVAQYRGTPFEKALEAAFRKLTGQLSHTTRYSVQGLHQALSFRPFGPEEADLATMELVSRALNQRRALRFSYRKPGGAEPDDRTLQPYHLTCIDNRWYLLGRDPERAEMRTFVLARMQNPVLTSDYFERPVDFNIHEYLRGSFRIMKGDGDYRVEVEFDAWATDIMRGRSWHWSQEVTELPGGGSRVALRVSCLEEVEEWVLRWGTHATAISPAALVDRLARTAQAIADKYAAAGADTRIAA